MSREDPDSLMERIARLEVNYEWIRGELTRLSKKVDYLLASILSSTVTIVITLVLTKLL